MILEHEAIPKAYRLARLLAVKETNLEESTFPEVCSYSLQETSDTGPFFHREPSVLGSHHAVLLADRKARC